MLLRKPPHTTWPRFLAGLCIPYSLGMMARDVLERPDRGLSESLRLQREYEAAGGGRPFSSAAAVAFLTGRGLPETQVREGSMPPEALERCGAVIRERVDPERSLTILHVGNFVGMSLAWCADFARSWGHGSYVIGVDPNVVHRGIERPQEHVIALLNEFGLQRHVLLLTGYTLAKNVGDAESGSRRRGFERDRSCEDALPLLAALAAGRVDVALMDGNHESAYLRRELTSVRTLLCPGGLLVLDDVFDWRSLADIARELRHAPDLRLLTRDNRFGIWQLP